ncbi:MAG TPA: hypothetical protein PKA82_13265 [Pyrinomonadaceae bacterium]|nr:hypothetical protein [Pyrinomonadaceae bacterium]
MIRLIALLIGLTLLLSISASGQLRLVPMKYSKVKLVNGKHSKVVDLDEVLIGSNGSLAGNPPHKYRVLFRASKEGFFYVVAYVRSSSPISNPMGPCGGDRPEAILWIKADQKFETAEFQSEIYASCSYNYYNSKLRITSSSLRAEYGGRTLKTLRYNNLSPNLGLIVTEMIEQPLKPK